MLRLARQLFPLLIRTQAFALLLSAAALACAVVLCITLFIDRIERTLNAEAAGFIAADLKLSGSVPATPSWLEHAHALGLSQAQFAQFNAMLFSDNGLKLARVKAVSNNYPLRGRLRVSRESDAEQDFRQTGPGPGELWLAPSLVSALKLHVGDSVRLGALELTLSAVVHSEPDSAASAFGVAPRAMINFSDVDATEAVQVGSRVDYAYLFAGEKSALESFRETLGELGEHHRWVSPADGNQAVKQTLARAQSFLLLAGGLAVLLAGVAIAIAANRFAAQQEQPVAVLMTFGARPSQIGCLYLYLLGALTAVAYLAGGLLGWSLHFGLIAVLASLLPENLASPGLGAWLYAALTLLIAVSAFALPPLFALRGLSPASILRQVSGRHGVRWPAALIALAAVMLLLLLYTENLKLSALILLCLACLALLSSWCGRAVLLACRRLQGRVRGPLRLGLGNLQRQASFSVLQIFVFASIWALMLVLLQIRTSLLEEWQPQLDDAPNHFVYNIVPHELDTVQSYFRAHDVAVSAYYPMVRGRLIQINEQPIKARIRSDSVSNYQRELNLTWSEVLGIDNTITEGNWWPDLPEARGLRVSAEAEYAAGLGLEIGDTLRFSIAGQHVVAVLSSIRSVEWDSMNPNFYMIFERSPAESLAVNWITSFRLSDEQSHFVVDLTQRFPGLTLIELADTLELIVSVIQRVIQAVEFILVLVVAAGLLVLMSTVYVSLDERRRESALLRSFGAPREFIQRSVIVEFVCLGLLAGVIACIAAETALWALQREVLDMPVHFHWPQWLWLPILSGVIIGTMGAVASLPSTHSPPGAALRTQI